MTAIEQRAGLLNALPMVSWDRCVRDVDGTLTAYGWISRDDGRSDFVVVAFLWPADPLCLTFWTSSAEHSADIARRLGGGDGAHLECEQIADVFGDLITNRVGGS